MTGLSKFYIFVFILLGTDGVFGQMPENDSSRFRYIIAGPEYKRPRSYQRMWGSNRRIEWTTPVKVPVLWLDTTYGGLTPYKIGGGNETKTLRLRTTSGKQYTLRSINKSRKDVIAPELKNTFIADIIKDGISMSYPYAAFAVSYMQEKAGIYHTLPVLVYLPSQPALDTFDHKFGNDLYLIEQRPEGDWKEADNLGNFEEFHSTEDVIKQLLKTNNSIADQHSFVKARLFDILISDWDRHEDNWEWGKKEVNGMNVYEPVPKDRDQAFYTHNGFLIDRMIPATGLSFMQNFDYDFGDVRLLNMEEKSFDRFFTNELNRSDWINSAKELQATLTDEVIEHSVRQLPVEIYNVSGEELVAKLKSRLKKLPDVASTYYSFIAKQVEVIGTSEREFFELNSTPSGELSVAVYRMVKNAKEDRPYYQRIFKPGETSEVRVFGIGGEDQFMIRNANGKIRIRIIGGSEKDTITQSGNRIDIYDNKQNAFQTSSARFHFSKDSSVHQHNYDWYNYDSKGVSPVFSYNYEDRVYAGLNLQVKQYKWRREPFANKHRIGINYSFSQKSISGTYDALYPRVIGKWDLMLHANYDFIRWTNFFGLGNETMMPKYDPDYYRLHSREFQIKPGISRALGKSIVEISPYYQYTLFRNDTALYAAEVFEAEKLFSKNQYGGLYIAYRYAFVNDSILPTRGITISTTSNSTKNFSSNDLFQKFEGRVQAYVPLSGKFSIMLRAGGATVVGNSGGLNNAQVFQHAVIGGPENLRGYRLERFWGRSSFYNNNEIRFITNLRTYLLNAKIGLTGFFDNGRVWMPDESSDKIHTSYGAGLLFAPFNFISMGLTYGISNESKLFQFRLNTLF